MEKTITLMKNNLPFLKSNPLTVKVMGMLLLSTAFFGCGKKK